MSIKKLRQDELVSYLSRGYKKVGMHYRWLPTNTKKIKNIHTLRYYYKKLKVSEPERMQYFLKLVSDRNVVKRLISKEITRTEAICVMINAADLAVSIPINSVRDELSYKYKYEVARNSPLNLVKIFEGFDV